MAIGPVDELVVVARFHDAAFVDDDDPVGHAYRGQAVGDDQDRAVLADRAHVAHHRMLGLVVERAGGLVEDQDAWIGDQRPGDGQALALPTRERGAVFTDNGVVARSEEHTYELQSLMRISYAVF